ncbi:hypothetical protein [Pseudochrobactrum saccharolyticum]|uniref:Uncharacterized protein n=1 Tax=Pseudochrobactrum saccharolyticum TaxID=354352 RepID=A0A7W8AIT0_9HYPH|nr:hypothetical protein [Pseudochrobactrum saccharolyticum]KAB0538981.1 hypothetical protein F7P81_07945 [Pseudochrobactrum saccharolyticum]MBB5091025.1 hypothetical protein [Pseudochrobactrum saccharolyticum]MDP8249734.1 hypothetical protein [Pseudochrobactrum saccharolyticum]
MVGTFATGAYFFIKHMPRVRRQEYQLSICRWFGNQKGNSGCFLSGEQNGGTQEAELKVAHIATQAI